MTSKIKRGRKSIFRELGLDTDAATATAATIGAYCDTPAERVFGDITGLHRTGTTTEDDDDGHDTSSYGQKSSEERSRQDDRDENGAITNQINNNTNNNNNNDHIIMNSKSPTSSTASTGSTSWYSRFSTGRRPRVKSAAGAPPPTMSTLARLSTIAVLIAVILPGFSSYFDGEKVAVGAEAGVVAGRSGVVTDGPLLDTRADSPTDACMRWSHQTASLNGTLYIYGGQAITSAGQMTDTWNNNFLYLDLTKSWSAFSPAFAGLPQPSGAPAVANGYLWNDYKSLFMYGGLFADNPYVEPAPVATWQYTISAKQWEEFSSPQTWAGNASDGGGQAVQRAAEGAGVSVPELGLSWYFGGHLDLSTTQGWSNQVDRVYLKSLLEFTHPGYANDGVTALVSAGAPSGGAYRNITEGGLQTDPGFYERADGVLVFVPGWGAKGVLIGLGGGTNVTFADDLSVLDVYDIASSQWYHQTTSGTAPSVRVNPCAVVAAAPDASSFQIYLFGGQNLQPYNNQTQYNDMYILSIPAFVWIQVSQSGNVPARRAGHSCNLRDGQIVVVGGYLGSHDKCDDSQAYIFNATSLSWTSSFNALAHANDLSPDNSVLAGSYGYEVPDPVASVIGGDGSGGATLTTPAVSATSGPFATGKAPVFTITTDSGGATVTQSGPGATRTADASSSSPTPSRRRALIAAGVVAGLAGLAALYLGYCAWLYRRQVRAYRQHLAVANRYSGGRTAGSYASLGGLAAALFGRKTSKKGGLIKNTDAAGGSGVGAGAGGAAAFADVSDDDRDDGGSMWGRRPASVSTAGSYSWIPEMTEPKTVFDEASPSGSGSGYQSSSPKPPMGYSGPYGAHPHHLPVPGMFFGESGSGTASGSGSAFTRVSGSDPAVGGVGGAAGYGGGRRRGSVGSSGGGSSVEGLLDGQEPSFFSVVLGPRRALRVVNGLEGDGEVQQHRG